MQSDACQLPADAHSLMQSPLDCRAEPSETSQKRVRFRPIQNPAFIPSNSRLSSNHSETTTTTTTTANHREISPTFRQCPVSFPEGRKPVRSLPRYCFAQSSRWADSKYRFAAYTFPGLKSPAASGPRMLSRSFTSNRNYAGCTNLWLITPGNQAWLSLGSRQLNRMILLVFLPADMQVVYLGEKKKSVVGFSRNAPHRCFKRKHFAAVIHDAVGSPCAGRILRILYIYMRILHIVQYHSVATSSLQSL